MLILTYRNPVREPEALLFKLEGEPLKALILDYPEGMKLDFTEVEWSNELDSWSVHHEWSFPVEDEDDILIVYPKLPRLDGYHAPTGYRDKAPDEIVVENISRAEAESMAAFEVVPVDILWMDKRDYSQTPYKE